MYTIVDFQIRLSYETWDSVKSDDVNKILDFLNIYYLYFKFSLHYSKKDNCIYFLNYTRN